MHVAENIYKNTHYICTYVAASKHIFVQKYLDQIADEETRFSDSLNVRENDR